MRKNISKVLIFLLALLLVIPLASCSNDDKKTNGEVTTNNEDEEVETGELDLPHATYGGQLVTIYTWQPYTTEFVLTEDEAYTNAVTQSLWERDMFVEEKLDIELAYYVYPDQAASKSEQFVNDLESSVLIGDGAYDYVIQQNAWAGVATLRGLYLNLNENAELDFSRDYWDSRLTDAVSLNDKVYFASGDIVTTVTKNVYCLHYNKNILADRSLENPIDLVNNNQWTWSKVFEMAKDLYVDSGTDASGLDDNYGFVAGALGALDCIYFSAGLTMIEKDEDGFFTVSPDYRSDRTTTFLKQIKDFFDGEDALYYHGDAASNFSSGKSLFYVAIAGGAGDYQESEAEFKVGVTPLPKYNEDQDGYYANITNNYSVVSVPFDCPNPEVSGAVMEYMAKVGAQDVIPALFEDTFKLQYSESNEDAQMFDYVRDSRTYDTGLLFGVDIFQFNFAKCIYGTKEWTSTAVQAIASAEDNLIPTLEKLGELKH